MKIKLICIGKTTETYLKEGHIQLALSHFERVNELAKDKPSAFPYLKIVVLQLKNCDKTAASKIYAGLQEAKSFRNTCRVSSALR